MFKAFYVPGPDELDENWFTTEQEAWGFISTISCSINDNKPCEMCQAEWDVLTKEEVEEIFA